jgi:hypothetical protein
MALATLPQAEQIACFLHHYAHVPIEPQIQQCIFSGLSQPDGWEWP